MTSVAKKNNKNRENGASAVSAEDPSEKTNPQPDVNARENRYRDFASIAVDLFWEIDADLKFTYLSDGYQEVTGVPASEVIGKTRKELLADLLEPRQRDEHFRVLDKRLPYQDLVYRWIGADGRVIFIKSWAKPFFDSGGNFAGYRGVARDITTSRLSEVALKASEERFHAFAEIAADIFWETNENLQFTFLSDRYEEVTGLSPDKVLNLTRQEVVLHRLSPEIRKNHDRVLAAQLPYDDLEYEWKVPGRRKMILSSSARPFFDGGGKFCGYRGVARDVTAARNAQQKLLYRATHDDLTGLVNRSEFQQCLKTARTSVAGNSETHVLCYLDLDQFKVVNDTVGHQNGDKLLKKISNVLRKHVRRRDTLGRLGGDEFGLLLERCTPQQGQEIAEALIDAVRDFQFCCAGQSFEIAVSIGMVPVDCNSGSSEQLLSQADVACYTAKDLGRNRVYIYQPEEDGLDRRHSEIFRAAELKDAINDDRISLVVQKIVPLRDTSNTYQHYEVLMRLQGIDGSTVMPGECIPAAERYGLMRMIDKRVVEKSIAFLRRASSNDRLALNINVSGSSLADNSLFEYVATLVRKGRLSPQQICFEITETALINNLTRAAEAIQVMKREGYRFALDDFGTGFSSLAYMKRLPVDILKIDGSFVRGILTDSRDRAIIKAIAEMSHAMGIEAVAECVESPDAANILAQLGVHWGQGYALANIDPLETLLH